MTISLSDYPRIILESSLDWRKQFRDFSAVLLNSEFRGAKYCIFPYRMRLQDGMSKVSEAAFLAGAIFGEVGG